MKKLLLLSILLLFITPVLAITTFVDDQANVISAQDKIRIQGVLKNIFDSKQAEYTVAIVQSLEGQDIESYTLNLAQGKLGDTLKNNGLLLLVSIEDRKYRFEVGRGIEPILNDAKVGRIGRTYLVENFKSGNYGQGILEASVAIAKEFNIELTGEIPRVTQRESPGGYFSLFIFLLIILSIFGGLGRRHHRRTRFFNAAIMAGLMFGGRGRGGFGGSGSIGGMGGSLGGGGFGGGGASGGW